MKDLENPERQVLQEWKFQSESTEKFHSSNGILAAHQIDHLSFSSLLKHWPNYLKLDLCVLLFKLILFGVEPSLNLHFFRGYATGFDLKI